MKISWAKTSLLFLFVVAIIGTSLRATFISDLPFQYSNLVHAHSHTAFQGWIYTILLLLITRLFIDKEQIKKGQYPLQFKLTLFVIVGVLVAFTLQGYGLFSILFSSLFQLLNYWFIFSVFRDVKKEHSKAKDAPSLRFVKTGLWLGILSTLMPWGIGILSANGFSGTEIYQSTIYAFLHFQYNGWFLFVAFGVFFKCLEIENIVYDRKLATLFYWCFTIAVVPALSLSLLGMSFRDSILVPAYLASLIQIAGSIFFFILLKDGIRNWFYEKQFWFRLLLTASLISFFLKTILQLLSVFQIFEIYAFDNKNTVLAYLHLCLIGMISFFLLAILIELKWLIINWFSKIGNTLLLLGFTTTELILVTSGLGLFYSPFLLFVGSGAMAIGILFLLFSPQKQGDVDGKF